MSNTNALKFLFADILGLLFYCEFVIIYHIIFVLQINGLSTNPKEVGVGEEGVERKKINGGGYLKIVNHSKDKIHGKINVF